MRTRRCLVLTFHCQLSRKYLFNSNQQFKIKLTLYYSDLTSIRLFGKNKNLKKKEN